LPLGNHIWTHVAIQYTTFVIFAHEVNVHIHPFKGGDILSALRGDGATVKQRLYTQHAIVSLSNNWH